jgi:hypothetical protein
MVFAPCLTRHGYGNGDGNGYGYGNGDNPLVIVSSNVRR